MGISTLVKCVMRKNLSAMWNVNQNSKNEMSNENKGMRKSHLFHYVPHYLFI